MNSLCSSSLSVIVCVHGYNGMALTHYVWLREIPVNILISSLAAKIDTSVMFASKHAQQNCEKCGKTSYPSFL